MSAASSSDESDTDVENTQFNDTNNGNIQGACFDHADTMTNNYDDIPVVMIDHDEYGDNEDDYNVQNESERMNNRVDDRIAWFESVEPNFTNDVFIHYFEVLDNGLNEDGMITVELNVSEVVIENDNDWTAFPYHENINTSTPKAVHELTNKSPDTSDEDDIPLAFSRKTSSSNHNPTEKSPLGPNSDCQSRT